ncbi:helix-turn-helix domain-containing protein [Pseudonocardia oroxyli]|uniref:helix-turn-helix domain-containing protein n=1 Tax=Pseudonocardia oroxyli TaxID=366584 RepID=UPI0015A4A139|nr:helix-turn-helix transcriptional regulator [Pseudonocardia oroxyli]
MGALLKEVRLRTDLSLEEAATAIQRSAATLSRLERGRQQKVRILEVTALLDHYRSTRKDAFSAAEQEHILQLTERSTEREWFRQYGGPMTTENAARYAEYENDASVIRSFEPELVPGLLQTRGYAEAVTDAAFSGGDVPADQRARVVDLRIARQEEILSRPPGTLRFDTILGELALRRRVADVEVLREQLERLLRDSSAKRPDITIRIAPIELGHHALVGGPFVVMDMADPEENGVVYLETRGDPLFLDSDDTVDRFRGLYTELSAAVLTAQKSRALITRILKDLH